MTTGSQGMTLRDYFAARAPEIPQPWFVSNFMPKAMPIKPSEEFCENCKADSGDCTTPTICESIHEWNRQTRNITVENSRNEAKAFYLQWPWAYADAMIEARRWWREGQKEVPTDRGIPRLIENSRATF